MNCKSYCKSCKSCKSCKGNMNCMNSVANNFIFSRRFASIIDFLLLNSSAEVPARCFKKNQKIYGK